MSATDTGRETVENVLTDALATMGPDRSQVTREATLEQLDIDSLDIVELAQIIEESWGVEIDAEDFSGVVTVGDTFDLVIARLR
jgi:acyl carrier protein